MASSESNIPGPQTEVAESEESGQGVTSDYSSSGIPQEILTKIRGSILSKSANGSSVSSLSKFTLLVICIGI